MLIENLVNISSLEAHRKKTLSNEIFLFENNNDIEAFLSSNKNIAVGAAHFSKRYNETAEKCLDENTFFEKEIMKLKEFKEEEFPMAYSLIRPLLPICRKIESELFCRKRLIVKTVKGQMCPLFHVDKIFARIIVTIIGPGTEWLLEKDSDRINLGKGGRKPVLKPGGTIQQISGQQVAILKGARFKGSKGLVHRSPPADPLCDTRLILRIDFS